MNKTKTSELFESVRLEQAKRWQRAAARGYEKVQSFLQQNRINDAIQAQLITRGTSRHALFYLLGESAIAKIDAPYLLIYREPK